MFIEFKTYEGLDYHCEPQYANVVLNSDSIMCIGQNNKVKGGNVYTITINGMILKVSKPSREELIETLGTRRL